MADNYGGPYGTYATTGTYNAQAKLDMTAMTASMKALFIPVAGTSAAHPDFQKIEPAVAAQLGKELDAMNAVIQAT